MAEPIQWMCEMCGAIFRTDTPVVGLRRIDHDEGSHSYCRSIFCSLECRTQMLGEEGIN